MTSTKKKLSTSVTLSRKVLDDLRVSGVKNLSRYVEGLIRKDLYNYEKGDKEVDEELKKLQTELDKLSKDWEAYEKRQALEAQRRKREADKLPDPDPLPAVLSAKGSLCTRKKKKY